MGTHRWLTARLSGTGGGGGGGGSEGSQLQWDLGQGEQGGQGCHVASEAQLRHLLCRGQQEGVRVDGHREQTYIFLATLINKYTVSRVVI